jgi:hypothetical protein
MYHDAVAAGGGVVAVVDNDDDDDDDDFDHNNVEAYIQYIFTNKISIKNYVL